MKKYLLILLSTLPILTSAQQKELEKYDLKRCIEIGLERNFSIKVAKNREQIARNNATIGNAGYLPTLNLAAGYSGTLNETKTEARDGITTENPTAHNTNTNAGINLNWTLFDGLYVQANYERLQDLKRQGELQTRLSIENYMATIASEYYNYIRQSKLLKTNRYAVSLSRERLRIVEARYILGNFSRLDLQQARVDFNADSSKWVKQKEIARNSVYTLNKLMAVNDIYSTFQPQSQEIDINYSLQQEELYNSTLASNANLLLSAKARQLSEIDLKAIKSRNYPYLKLNGGYGYTLNQYEVTANRSQQTMGFNYGITVGFTLFDGLNRSREQKNARIAIINAENQHQELEIGIRTDFASFYDAYTNNLALVKLEEDNLTVAQENYEIAMERYKLGTLTGLELREAQKSLLDAEERLVTSQYNTKLCEISLLQIAGQITNLIQN